MVVETLLVILSGLSCDEILEVDFQDVGHSHGTVVEAVVAGLVDRVAQWLWHSNVSWKHYIVLVGGGYIFLGVDDEVVVVGDYF